MTSSTASIKSAQIVLPCGDLAATLDFFVETLGFRIDMIMPADAPSTAVISGHGVALRLENGADGAVTMLRLACDLVALPPGKRPLRAPNGLRLEWVDADAPIVVPDARQS
ncbi:MAG: VOC family protein, partial [Rhodanobacteraceae bacterium]